jgi:hypothetical protein
LDLQARFDRKQSHGRMIYLLARKAYSEKLLSSFRLKIIMAGFPLAEHAH